MDARLVPLRVLGLEAGDAHIIRNAGGIVTNDAIRSLAISQRKLGTEEIVLLHHTDCGMAKFTDEEFVQELESETGARPDGAQVPSRTPRRACASRSAGSGRARSSRTRTCAGTSMR